jgi:hypothetical protein
MAAIWPSRAMMKSVLGVRWRKIRALDTQRSPPAIAQLLGRSAWLRDLSELLPEDQAATATRRAGGSGFEVNYRITKAD